MMTNKEEQEAKIKDLEVRIHEVEEARWLTGELTDRQYLRLITPLRKELRLLSREIVEFDTSTISNIMELEGLIALAEDGVPMCGDVDLTIGERQLAARIKVAFAARAAGN